MRIVKLFIVGVAVVAVCISGAALLLGWGRSAPVVRRIAFPTYEFKPNLPGSSVSHTFVIRNDDNYPLHLRDLSVSCKCLQGTLDRTTIGPHESANLAFRMALVDYEETSRLRAILTGEQNGAPIQFEFNLIGQAVDLIEYSDKSNYFDFGRCEFGGTTLTYPPVRIRRGKFPMAWDAITCSTDDSGLLASLKKDGDDWQLNLTYKPSTFIGPISNAVEFHFWKDGKELTQRTSKRVSVDVHGPVYANPSSWLIGAVTKGETRQGQIEFKSRVNPLQKVKVVGFELLSGKSIRGITAPEPSEKLDLSFTAGNASGPDSGDMAVEVSDGSSKYKVRVSYMTFVQEDM